MTPNGDENVRLREIALLPHPTPMLPSLFYPGSASQARVLPGDSALSIRAKAVAILERSTYMARRTGAGDFTLTGKGNCQETFAHAFGDHGYPCGAGLTALSNGYGMAVETPTHLLTHMGAAYTSQLCDLFYVRFAQLDEAIQTFQASLPPLTPEDLSNTPLPPALASAYIARSDIDTSGEDFMEVGWCPAQSPRTHTLICGHAMSLAASVQLHAMLCETNSESHARMLECALQMTELSRMTLDVDPRCFPLMTIVTVHFPVVNWD